MEGIKIVYVEDQRDMIEWVDLILGSRGYTVIGAEHGPEGMDIIERECPQLILVDLMMPDMNGWQLYDKLRSDNALKSIPVIMWKKPENPLACKWDEWQAGAWGCNPHQRLFPLEDAPQLAVGFFTFTAKRDKISELLGLNFAGVDGYVNKADGPKALIDNVENVLARHERI